VTLQAIFTGAHVTQVGELPGRGSLSLMAEAGLAAIADAGLAAKDIDGLLCAYSISEPHPMLTSWYAEYVGLSPRTMLSIQMGGATGCMLVAQAAALIEAGYCRNVLIATGENRLSGLARDGAVAALADFGHPEFERPYGFSIPAAYALVAQRYMHEYGITLDELADIAVTQREHAIRHPKAHKRTPITRDEVNASRVIASPLRLLDCCLISDGGAAVVLSASDSAKDTRHADVALLGSGQGHTHEHLVAAPSLVDFGCRQSAAAAFERAGVKPAEIDVAEIYDSFTITLAVTLESSGLLARGEAGTAAREGALRLGGRLPCNTHGGLLSFGHSGAAGGLFHVIEAVEQLRHVSKDRQVPDAALAFVHGCGGVMSAHSSLVMGRVA
jgi:acetyl-CoA acetyltransferase